jgi:hypothetical protein
MSLGIFGGLTLSTGLLPSELGLLEGPIRVSPSLDMPTFPGCWVPLVPAWLALARWSLPTPESFPFCRYAGAASSLQWCVRPADSQERCPWCYCQHVPHYWFVPALGWNLNSGFTGCARALGPSLKNFLYRTLWKESLFLLEFCRPIFVFLVSIFSPASRGDLRVRHSQCPFRWKALMQGGAAWYPDGIIINTG